MQWLEGMIVLDKELEINKKNDQALDSLINFSFFILQTYFSTYIHTGPLHMTFSILIFTFKIITFWLTLYDGLS